MFSWTQNRFLPLSFYKFTHHHCVFFVQDMPGAEFKQWMTWMHRKGGDGTAHSVDECY